MVAFYPRAGNFACPGGFPNTMEDGMFDPEEAEEMWNSASDETQAQSTALCALHWKLQRQIAAEFDERTATSSSIASVGALLVTRMSDGTLSPAEALTASMILHGIAAHVMRFARESLPAE